MEQPNECHIWRDSCGARSEDDVKTYEFERRQGIHGSDEYDHLCKECFSELNEEKFTYVGKPNYKEKGYKMGQRLVIQLEKGQRGAVKLLLSLGGI